MSKSQKHRKYGTHQAPSAPRSGSDGTRDDAAVVRSPHVYEVGAGQLAAEPTRSSSAGVVVVVLCVVALALWAYYHLVILQGLSTQLAHGVSAPELLPGGFGPDHLRRFAHEIGADGPGDYAGVHWTTGLFTPLFVTGAFTAYTGLNTPRGTRRWIYWVVGLLYAVVFLAGNLVLEAALASGGGLAAAASALVIGRWVLTGALVVIAAMVAVAVVRDKVDAFSRGELPGQQPRGL